MDFTLRRDKSNSSYLNALKSTAKRSGRRPPSFATPPHFSYLDSLPEYRLPNIPPDLVTEILSRLPIQSLLRFRCVCNPWRDSISDPRLALSFQNWKIAIRYGKGLYDLNLHSESDKVPMVELQYPMRKKEIGGTEEVEMPQFEILGSCRGLLLIRRDMDYFSPVNRRDMDFYLWNPTIRQCTKVLSLPQRDKDIWYESPMTGCGLCYDSSTDEYKAVMAYKRCDTYDACTGMAVVASLKSKHWTSYCFPYQLESGPVVNKRLHWVVKRDENGTRFPARQIVCFDPLVDEFVELSTPPSYDGYRNVILGLGILDGCLCVARHCHNIKSDYESDHEFGYWSDYEAYDYIPDIEVLIMKEYGVEESWTSLFVMSHFGGLSTPYRHRPYRYGCFVPLCLTENGKVLVAVNVKQILVYNPSEDSRRHITSPTNIFAYEESLVSPDSCGGGNDWRIERVDAWNYVYCDDSDRSRQKYDWCPCCAYDPSQWDGMYDWEVDGDYDWEEEDFLKKEKQRHRMKIRTENL